MKDNDVGLDETVSPKTPGGISKALLTPIRRLGLSRKWKKSGGSPFVSPLASTSPKLTESVDDVKEKLKKRKLCVDDENINSSSLISEKNYECNIVSTPTSVKDKSSSKVSIIRKKSKIISSYDEDLNTSTSEQTKDHVTLLEKSEDYLKVSPQIEEIDEVLVNKKSNNNFSINNTPQIVKKYQQCTNGECMNEINNDKLNETNALNDLREPNNLIKECIVVIQNKIIQQANKAKKINTKSQFVSDSDSDDIPLNYIYNKKESNYEDDNDFATSSSKNSPKVQPVKKTDSISNRKSTKSSKKKTLSDKYPANEKKYALPATQSSNSFDDDDDDDFEVNKKTVLTNKSYNKVMKPVKAKSTGSITQKDIEELKARIEIKKKFLLAKAMNKDTEELRELIKKWQKGCQDALLELLELMKKKLPDRANMDNSYILQMLKIPHTLVGYDAENDCFNTPDDNSILAATFNDI